MRWLAVLLVVRSARAPMKLNELDLLKNFYNVTGGADWVDNTNWDIGATSQCGWVDNSVPDGWPYVAPEVTEVSLGPGCIYKDPCAWDTKWKGVGCVDPCYAPTDGDNCAFGRVTYFDLPYNSLVGTIPEAFFDELLNISFIDLSYNAISGTLPTQIGKVRNLIALHLNNNNFQGTIPTEIAHMGHSLGYDEGFYVMDFSYNNFTGTLPSQVAYLSALQSLDISHLPNFGHPSYGDNLFMNPGLPSQIGLLTGLASIRADFSAFQGFIPTQIGLLTNLLQLLMRGSGHELAKKQITNQFSGTIPTQIGMLTRLDVLGLSNNLLSGTIPEEIGNMQWLRRFELAENKLSGTMPNVFDEHGLGGPTGILDYWDTYGNKLTGDLPNTIGNATSLQWLYIQIEHSDPLRNFRCGQRIPGLGNSHNNMNVDSNDPAPNAKYNWAIMAWDYFNMMYTTECPNPHDVNFAFNALSGDV